MAIKQSLWAKGNQQSKRPQTAGAVHTQLFSYDAAAGLLAADILELGELPPGCRVVDAILFTEGTFTGLTADVGIMSGTYGDPDASRTSGNQLYDDADLTAVVRLSKRDMLLLAPVEGSRGIGLKVSADVAAGAGKKIHLQLSYIQ